MQQEVTTSNYRKLGQYMIYVKTISLTVLLICGILCHSYVVSAESVNCFKNRLQDNFWKDQAGDYLQFLH